MPGCVRPYIAERLFSGVMKGGVVEMVDHQRTSRRIQWGLRIPQPTKATRNENIPLSISYSHLEKQCGICEGSTNTASFVDTDDFLQDCQSSKNGLHFLVSASWFTENVLRQVAHEKHEFGFKSVVHEYAMQDDVLRRAPAKQRVLVEFSSPNIAKPFHAGHLRSTVLGNFVNNLYRALGHDVTSINFLGDWGTQFGYLGVGFSKFGSAVKLLASPMQHLFEAYVKANKEAESNEAFHKDAMNFFASMEKGDSLALEFWTKCRELSIEEYKKTYKRLGVKFDVYDGESLYHKNAADVMKLAEEKGVLKTNAETGVQFLDLSSVAEPKQPVLANVMKSDGSTLYITRDIAALADRKLRYDFDRMLYIVDESQKLHFEQLILSCKALELIPISHQPSDYHVHFGRVSGMSTRRGDVVFLTDIINEGRDRMVTNMLQTETTKVSEEEEIVEVAERLAVSALIVHNLNVPRYRTMPFNWDAMLKAQGHTGPSLQYLHARLSSLLRVGVEEMGLEPEVNDVDFRLLAQDAHALNVVQSLARFDEAVHKALVDLAPQYITTYLFELATIASKALRELRVKDQPPDVARARLLMFACTRQTLGNGLRLLGIEPLEKM